VLRSGNPAEPLYEAELLYISPLWISKNASLITEEHPKGTGERDYALLYITKGYDDAPLPGAFPFLSVDTEFLKRDISGKEVIAVGYPAEDIQSEGASVKLVPKVATTTIHKLYTYGSNYADVFSIGDSVVAKQGSSGGPVIEPDSEEGGSVIGLIVAKGQESTSSASELHALTLSYIDRTMLEETGFSLRDNIRGNIPYRARIFKEVLIPFLSGIINQSLFSSPE
jgi:hypothetical protein